MTAECASAISRRVAPEACLQVCPRKSEGAGNAGCRLAPAVSCARCTQECAHEHTGTAGAARHSLRNGFTAYAELSPETNSSCLRRRRIDGLHRPGWALANLRQLDTSHGCQNHTVLPYAASSAKPFGQPVPPTKVLAKAFKRRSSARRARSRKTALRTSLAPDAAASTATRPNVRDDGQRPSSRDGMAGVVRVICGRDEAEYFCGRGWTGQISLKMLEKIAHWRSGADL